jgi:hypothetical protein
MGDAGAGMVDETRVRSRTSRRKGYRTVPRFDGYYVPRYERVLLRRHRVGG